MARVRSVGWRSARWYGEPATVGGTTALAPAMPAPTGSAASGFTADAKPLAAGALDERYLVAKWPWQGVNWTLGYVGFLLYVFVVTTYTLPIGTAAMGAALVGVVFGERMRFTPIGMVYLAFFAFATLSFLGSEWRDFSSESWTNLGKIVLILLTAQIVLDNRERVRFFVFFYLGVFALYPVRGAIFNYFLYHATEDGRAAWNGTFGNPNDIAALLLFPFALALGLISVERNKQLRTLAMGALICIPLVLSLAQSRSAMLALMGGGALFFMQNKRARMMMFVGAAVVGLVFAVLAPDQLWKRMSSLEQVSAKGQAAQLADNGSMEQRLEIWKVSVVVIAQHPLLGVGPGSYPFAHVFAARDPNVLQTAGGLRDAHSTYFTVLAEYGTVGFVVYMIAPVLVLLKSRKARKAIQRQLPRHAQQLLLAEIGLVSYGAASVFGTYILVPFTYLSLAIVWALAETAEKDARDLAVGGPVVSRTA